MKMQLAFLEALLSLLISLSLISLSVYAYSGSVLNLYHEKESLSGKALEYDMFVQLHENESMYNCVESFYYSNSTCLNKYLEIYREEYRIGEIEVTVGGKSIGIVKEPLASACTPLNNSIFCIEVG